MRPPFLAAFQAHGNSLARHVYAFVTKEGTKKANGLTAEEEELTWATVRLSHVAVSRRSIRDLKNLLDTLRVFVNPIVWIVRRAVSSSGSAVRVELQWSPRQG